MKVAITGAHGLIGRALVDDLAAGGHTPVRVVRTPDRAGDVPWDPARGVLDARELAGVDAVVHLAGAGIGEHRWTAEVKAAIRSSRVDGTALLARTIAQLDPPPAVLLSGSAIGWYGNGGEQVLTEGTPRGAGFLAELCGDWESAASPARDAGIRVAHLRTGVVLARHGGALARQLLLFRFGAGGPLGGGRQWVSWITLSDEVAAIRFLLEAPVEGPVNLCAPAPARQKDFARAIGRALHRPVFMPAPAAALHLVLGREFADELLLVSQRVVPAALESHGFSFAHPGLDDALGFVIGRGGRAT